ncbi:grf1-interacting factor 3 [Micractinium conductrix]|uniref:Grf1-interacting factor 3 n=1 Tax=Micractinium conductrix TaxID=554055 RepID=A0A2P6VB47_9CHLO|nr:grf1-interacting factor 3 [Micractinium conductrix]|eukprot:PSC71322.1 grf1-interacting factor 3 [Micractinium conductrix]
MLEENSKLIAAIVENQNIGKLDQCVEYQKRLQENLMSLAALADSQATPQQQPAGGAGGGAP